MSNVTLVVDDDVLRRAKIKAALRGTSVNAVVREFLQQYVGPSNATAALQAMFDQADAAAPAVGEAGITWTREELHDRAQLR